MDLIILSHGLYQLIPVTKQIMADINIVGEVDLFELCDILKLKLTTYNTFDNKYVMNDGSGYFYGCIQN